MEHLIHVLCRTGHATGSPRPILLHGVACGTLKHGSNSPSIDLPLLLELFFVLSCVLFDQKSPVREGQLIAVKLLTPASKYTETVCNFRTVFSLRMLLCCSSTVTAASSFLEAFQRVADMATSTRGNILSSLFYLS